MSTKQDAKKNLLCKCFMEEGNAFKAFVRPRRYTQCAVKTFVIQIGRRVFEDFRNALKTVVLIVKGCSGCLQDDSD